MSVMKLAALAARVLQQHPNDDGDQSPNEELREAAVDSGEPRPDVGIATAQAVPGSRDQGAIVVHDDKETQIERGEADNKVASVNLRLARAVQAFKCADL